MKKIFVFSLALISAASLFAGGKKDTAAGEVTVFAAASMTEALNEIAALYAKKNGNVKLVFNFDSSGTLKTQIDQGAGADIFISAASRQMDQLAETGSIDWTSRFTLVENSVVLIVPKGSTKGISDFKDLNTAKVSLASLGNADVPVGQYSAEIYTSLGIWDALKNSGKITWGSNVKEVLSHVSSGAVDCGIVYSTDAATASGVTVAARAPEGSHQAIVYPAAILTAAPNPEGAASFLAFLKDKESGAVLKRIGFVVP